MANMPNLKRAAGNRFSTALSSGISDSDLSIAVDSVSGLNADGGVLILDESNATKREMVCYLSYTGTTLTIADDGRGFGGTVAVAHDTGAIVTDVIAAEMFNDFIDTFEVAHNDDGTFKASVIVDAIYPVGSIYTSVVSTNPGTLLGAGTWAAFGAGKVLVGLDSGDTDFDTAEETGGEKAHTLTTGEIPKHEHTASGVGSNIYNETNTIGSGALSRNLLQLTSSAFQQASIGKQTTGDGAHNNLQPYIVVYFWKRTA